MFVGHYSTGFVAKGMDKTIPLWLLFIAVQFVDVLWAIFVLLGIEKARIVAGFTAWNPLDLYYMPYTHSLVAALAWSAVGFVLYKFLRRAENRAAWLVAAAIFSHWILDLLVHRPDLPLYDDSYKIGFGIWNYPVIAFVLESIVLLGGLWFYLRSTVATSNVGKYAMTVFTILMLLLHLSTHFGPIPTTDKAMAIIALSFYFSLAAIAFWLERTRQ